ncbi:MAG: PadR family transcriptional regulator, partial [Pseudomonadota bacterium]|nr:PadR family transcriptional regulator [Pseudomonadota bacterium]
MDGEGPAGEVRYGGGRRGGRPSRMFDGGDLRLVLLKLIADKSRHGYDLIRAIEEKTGGAYAPSPGVVYPTLTLFAEMGFLKEQAADGPRKLFEITSEGNAYLAEQAAQ